MAHPPTPTEPPEPRSGGGLEVGDDGLRSLRRLGRFGVRSLQKARRDKLPTESAALAFVTMIALVPLLAGLSYFSVGFFDDRQEELVDLLARVLPYSEQAITAKLGEFLVESRELRGFGFLAFLLTALTAFGMIENSINDIWRVTRRRAFRSQLSSFVLLLCWGPILIGATYSVLFLLRKSPAFGSLTETFLLSWAPFLVTLVGLTMLNWQVPRTAVRFGSAFAGGAVSALLVEVIRSGFAFYVARADQISIVYSSFGFVFFFVVSIQLTWLIVLAGTELAYCVQNFDYMSRRGVSVGVVEGSWLGLAAMVLVTERFHRGTPITPRELLAQKLDLDAGELHGTLLPLLDAGYLQESSAGEGYLLSSDPYQLPVADLLELYESRQMSILGPLPESAARRLGELRTRFAEARLRASEGTLLADLLAPGSSQPAPAPAPRAAAKSEDASPATKPRRKKRRAS
ncbi:MAG: YihY family inner membrane protein [Holophagales bacterium]|nr:YihY family inner membrane protein [Holophagales bacterium]